MIKKNVLLDENEYCISPYKRQVLNNNCTVPNSDENKRLLLMSTTFWSDCKLNATILKMYLEKVYKQWKNENNQ